MADAVWEEKFIIFYNDKKWKLKLTHKKKRASLKSIQ